MCDQADSFPQNSFGIIKQAIEQSSLNSQAEFSPVRSSSAQAQESPSTPSPTPPLIFCQGKGVMSSTTYLVI